MTAVPSTAPGGWRAHASVAAAPWRDRYYRIFLAARVLSAAGSAIAPVALAFAALDVGGTAAALGEVLAAGCLPQLLVALIGGVATDRYPRAPVLPAGNIALAALQIVASVLLLTGHAGVPALAGLSAASGMVTAFLDPATKKTLPSLVAPGLLQQANALAQTAFNGIKVLVPVVGGPLIALTGPGYAVAFDAVTFLVAAVLLAQLPETSTSATTEPATAWAGFQDGWRAFRAHGWLMLWSFQGCVTVPLWLVGYVLLGPAYAKAHLGGPAGYGLMATGWTAGLVLGALACMLWSPRRLCPVAAAVSAAMAMPMAAMAAAAPLPVLLTAIVTAGAALNISAVSFNTLLPRIVEQHRLGRVLSLNTAVQLVFLPPAYLLAGQTAVRFGLNITFTGIAVVLLLCAALPPCRADFRALTLDPHTPPPKEIPVLHPSLPPGTATTPPAAGEEA
ncbi:MFS transporter [Streptomyces sp. UNOB3_S3]|uniref:MFS transporter n=1 Tax=Streptomyces sp. UNOB3_S3 TaxID=2871682 RepID=UPI001E48691C|nr:MFS transporter [Streptomyces sp. UNOB3_S3]MCC3773333.1 MFS transporter [Streptomyces sp. UNOB3_S3]